MWSVSMSCTEGQATHETAGEALGAQPLHVVFGAFAALCRHGEDAAINADVHRIGVHAREVGVKHVVIAGAVEVHRHGQWDSGGSGRCTEQLPGESVDVTEWIGMKHSNHLLHAGCRTSPPRRVSAGCAPSGVALHLREHQGCRRCAQVFGDQDPGVQDRLPPERGHTCLDLLADVGRYRRRRWRSGPTWARTGIGDGRRDAR